MDFISKRFKEQEDKKNKVLDEFWFKKDGEEFRVQLVKEWFLFCPYWINLCDNTGWQLKCNDFYFLFTAKRYFKKLKKKYGNSKKLTRFEQIKEFLGF